MSSPIQAAGQLRYLIPSSITLLSMACALMAMTSPDPLGDAPWWILYSVLLDKLDGTFARLLRAQTRFGLQLDSFADFLAFGVAPAAVLMKIGRTTGFAGGLTLLLTLVVGLFYAVSTYARLRRFNLEAGGRQSHVFRGMPSTLAGATFGTYVLTFCGPGDSWGLALLPLLMVALGVLMTRQYRGWKPRPASRRDLLILQSLLAIYIYVTTLLRFHPEVLFLILTVVYAMSMTWIPREEEAEPEDPEPGDPGQPMMGDSP